MNNRWIGIYICDRDRERKTISRNFFFLLKKYKKKSEYLIWCPILVSLVYYVKIFSSHFSSTMAIKRQPKKKKRVYCCQFYAASSPFWIVDQLCISVSALQEWKLLWYGIYQQREGESRENKLRTKAHRIIFYVIFNFLSLNISIVGIGNGSAAIWHVNTKKSRERKREKNETTNIKRLLFNGCVDTLLWIHSIISCMMAICPYVNVIIIWTSLLSTCHYSAQITYNIF